MNGVPYSHGQAEVWVDSGRKPPGPSQVQMKRKGQRGRQSLPWGLDHTFHLSAGSHGPAAGKPPQLQDPSCFCRGGSPPPAQDGLTPRWVWVQQAAMRVWCILFMVTRDPTHVSHWRTVGSLSAPVGDLTLGLGAGGLFPASLCFISLPSSHF